MATPVRIITTIDADALVGQLDSKAAERAVLAANLRSSPLPRWREPCRANFSPSEHRRRVGNAAVDRAWDSIERADAAESRGDLVLSRFWAVVAQHWATVAARNNPDGIRFGLPPQVAGVFHAR